MALYIPRFRIILSIFAANRIYIVLVDMTLYWNAYLQQMVSLLAIIFTG